MRRRTLGRLLGGGLEATWQRPSRLGPVGRLGRKAVRRGAQPVVGRQALVDRAIREAIDESALLAEAGALAAGAPDARTVAFLDTEIGEVLFHADDEVMTPFVRHHRVWEADEVAFFRRTLREGAVFVDCGANVGWFSLLGSQLVGTDGLVVAVEPEPRNLSLLRLNLWRHAAINTLVVPAAAGAGRGLVGLHIDEGNRGDHQVHHVGAEQGRAVRLVPMLALDEVLAEQAVDVVKIDAQGFDHEVFRGLARTLGRSGDVVLLVEFWLTGMEERGVDAAAVLQEYRAAGFGVGLLRPDGGDDPRTDAEILAAAEDGGTRVVNLILRRT